MNSRNCYSLVEQLKIGEMEGTVIENETSARISPGSIRDDKNIITLGLCSSDQLLLPFHPIDLTSH